MAVDKCISPTWCLGRPTMEGKTARGASSPANPALHIPDPLSTTSAAISSSMAELQKAKKKGKWRKRGHPLTLEAQTSPSAVPLTPPERAALSLPVQFAAPASRGSALRTGAEQKGNGAAFYHYHIRTWLDFRAALRLPAPWRSARDKRGA